MLAGSFLPQSNLVTTRLLFRGEEFLFHVEIEAAVDHGQAIFYEDAIQQSAVGEEDVSQQPVVAVARRVGKGQGDLFPLHLLYVELLRGTVNLTLLRRRDTLTFQKCIAMRVIFLRCVDADQAHGAKRFDFERVTVVNPGNRATQSRGRGRILCAGWQHQQQDQEEKVSKNRACHPRPQIRRQKMPVKRPQTRL